MSDTTKFAPAVPAAVRRQAEAADEAVRQLQAEQDANRAETSPGAPEGTPSPPSEQPESPAGSPPGSPRDGAAAGPAPTPTPGGPQEEGWEQRYRTLRGKYDTEVPTLQNQLRTLERTMTELQLQLQNPPPPPPSTPVVKPVPISDEDIEAYGPELIDRARSWARAELMPEIEQLRHDVVRANGTAQNVQSQAAMQSVYNFMDQNLPSWNDINTDPRFIEWLRGTDPLSGSVRQNMLSAAFLSGDARRTLSFFRAFQTEHTEDHFQPGTTHTYANGSAGAVRLEDMAGPGRGAPVSPGAPATKRHVTQKDIADFYSAVTKGRFNGRDAERQRIEQELHEAVYEGRVRN